MQTWIHYIITAGLWKYICLWKFKIVSEQGITNTAFFEERFCRGRRRADGEIIKTNWLFPSIKLLLLLLRHEYNYKLIQTTVLPFYECFPSFVLFFFENLNILDSMKIWYIFQPVERTRPPQICTKWRYILSWMCSSSLVSNHDWLIGFYNDFIALLQFGCHFSPFLIMYTLLNSTWNFVVCTLFLMYHACA